ncbi:MAG: winged helix-turn-helix domain-containing protein [Allosphingosinicella sp.]
MADDRDETGPAPVILAHRPAFRLGATEVRPGTREIVGPGGGEIVEPRVMQVLVALAGADGGILSRDDLIQACWDGRIVSENAIDRVISRIRRLAETVANGSFRIETITKVGYRLLHDETSSASPRPASAEIPARVGKSPAIGRRSLIWGGATLMLGGAGVWLGLREFQPDVPQPAVVLYERGVESLRRGWAEDMANAISALREAVTIAPDYADAWGMLALAYQLSLEFAPPETAGAVSERGRSAARRALELDPANANALAAEALAVPIFRNWAASETALRRVLGRDPEQLETRVVLSRVFADVGRTREALAALQPIGEAISDLAFHQFWLGWLLFCANRLEESDRVIDRAFAIWPRQFAVWFTRLWLYAYTGRTAQALAMVGEAANRPIGIPERDFAIVELSVRAMATRSPTDVDAAVRANMAAAPDGTGFATNAAKVCSHLGRLDEAFAAAEALLLGRGFRVAPIFFTPQQGGYAPPERRATEFLFSPPCRAMRADPRFRPLLEELGLVDYWRGTGTAADVLARS